MNKKHKSSSDSNNLLREKILKSMIASFKIEGINISSGDAAAALKKVSLSLEK